ADGDEGRAYDRAPTTKAAMQALFSHAFSHAFPRAFSHAWTFALPFILPFALAFSLATMAHAAPLAVPRVAPAGGIWPAGDGFAFQGKGKKTRRAVSGIACAPDASNRRVCLLAFDEGVTMRFARIEDRQLRPEGPPLVLGREGDELDAEGAATDGRYFYVTGSHAVKRGDCQANPASQHVLRIARDGRTGMAAAPLAVQDGGSLLPLVRSLPPFDGPAMRGACLGEGGIDIEGLAVWRGRLFFGLRGPTGPEGAAYIVSLEADAFFAGSDARPEVRRVVVGAGRGIRDMVAVQDGLLLLAGPDDATAHSGLPWQLLLWRTGSQETSPVVPSSPKGPATPVFPQALAELDLSGVKLRGCDKEAKPEAITVLAETPARYQVLVLSDGLCDGGPMAFDIDR
ncbi:MAG: hypothetical protein JWQ88_1693, partial [Rhodoferax sp.]|nr:hypothetical protein [Rhodoferax sp.]